MGTKRLNLVMVSAFALLLGCLMFTSLDTAWGLTYQEGDVWIGTDGEQMTPEEAGQWEYDNDNTNNGIWLKEYTGEIIEGKIVGCIPATINDIPVTSMQSTFNRTYDLEIAPEIPNTVVNMYATFNNCTDLTAVPKIPDSVKDMTNTFNLCKSLVYVADIPDSVIDMHSTFARCTNLATPPKIGNSVEDMYSTFKDCTSLVNAPEIPNSVTNMDSTFEGCTSLTNVPNISDSVQSMKSTFRGCTSLVDAPEIPNSVTFLGSIFWDCTSLVNAPEIPSSVTDMDSTFRGCTSLDNAPEIPDSVTYMGGTFIDCTSLVNAPEIPKSVTDMRRTFMGCTNLSDTIFIPDTVTNAQDIFGECTEKEIIVQYTLNNTVIHNMEFTSNIIKELIGDTDHEGEDEEQDPTTPSNPGETSGNMSIYGTVQPITMIDVTVPLTIQFTIESDRTFTGPDSIEIKSNCPSPLDVNLYGVNKDDSAPSLVAPDTHSDDEWNNLNRAQTLASIALMLDNTSLSSTGSTLGRIDSAFQSEQALDLDLSAKYGKAWDNSEDLVFTYNVVFEFAMP